MLKNRFNVNKYKFIRIEKRIQTDSGNNTSVYIPAVDLFGSVILVNKYVNFSFFDFASMP